MAKRSLRSKNSVGPPPTRLTVDSFWTVVTMVVVVFPLVEVETSLVSPSRMMPLAGDAHGHAGLEAAPEADPGLLPAFSESWARSPGLAASHRAATATIPRNGTCAPPYLFIPKTPCLTPHVCHGSKTMLTTSSH